MNVKLHCDCSACKEDAMERAFFRGYLTGITWASILFFVGWELLK